MIHQAEGGCKVSDERVALSVQEVATKLGVSRDLINDAIRLQRLRSIKLGRRRIIPLDALEEFLARISTQEVRGNIQANS